MRERPGPGTWCSACGSEAPGGARFCPSCAAPLAAAPDGLTRTATPTEQAAAAARAPAPGVGWLASSDTIPVGGFPPGAILADRYRIIGLLGRGGMGEVYRADDLKLGQPVALKFLPRELASDPVRRERFLAEVRIARQVSHPNLCRVYDIGELESVEAGLQTRLLFLTMEYIDGEDLASLLRRIGFLPGQKALDLARQLCAGLAAAHDKGVLHRDLKPANVMVDGRGRARITDFGLALAAGDAQPGDEISGTPAYMAPEQLAGQGATTRSDIYALGLVLYELYTGKRTFDATTLAELRSQKEGATPTAPSELTRDMDPVVERVILRCLEKDPRARPSSVAHVAAALPGGDPLAAALAAGEMPSPEMVAAAGSSEGFSPRAAWLALALVGASLVATVPLMEQTMIYHRVALDRRPEVLADRARQILVALGHTGTPRASAYGFLPDQGLIDYIATHDTSPARWDHLPAETIRFWYRQRASGPLMRESFMTGLGGFPSVRRSYDPPLNTAGDVLVWLDPQGRLLELVVVPPEVENPAPAPAPDWGLLFQEAGLDEKQWTPTTPRYAPAFYADQRAAWTGTSPDRPQEPIHLEAAAHKGAIVSVRRVQPWTGAGRGLRQSVVSGDTVGLTVVFSVGMVVALVASVIVARRHLRLGRGDRRAATRLAWAMLGLSLASWALLEDHAADLWEIAVLFMAVCQALFWAGATWLLYLAVEPAVRRRWPHVLISWNRLLLGEFRDPLVGRDVLGGCMMGALLAVTGMVVPMLSAWAASSPITPLNWLPVDWFVAPTRTFAANILIQVFGGVLSNLALLVVLFLVRALVKKEWLAVVVLAAVFSSNVAFSPQAPAVHWILYFAVWAIWAIPLITLLRFGLVGAVASSVGALAGGVPLTMDLSAWYAGVGIAGVLFVLGFSVAAFVVSLGGRPMFGRMALEE